MRNFYNDFKSNEMDDGMFNGVLVEEHEQVQELRCNVKVQINEWDTECNIWMSEILWVVDHIFHNHH